MQCNSLVVPAQPAERACVGACRAIVPTASLSPVEVPAYPWLDAYEPLSLGGYTTNFRLGAEYM
jgi:hypothetical protein